MAVEQAGRPLGNRELAAAMGCSEGEASKLWQEVAAVLSVSRDGRHRVLALKATG